MYKIKTFCIEAIVLCSLAWALKGVLLFLQDYVNIFRKKEYQN